MREIGDMQLPKTVFFFDEAHMLFKDTSKALTDKIEQIVRLIRSKGVGVYFISQSPSDLPETILGQCGNRVQHALRAFTPKDQAAVKSAARTFRQNPAFETDREITPEQRNTINESSRISGKYESAVDRESAFEQIMKQREAAEKEAAQEAARKAEEKAAEKEEKERQKKSSKSRSSSTGKSIFSKVLGTAFTYFAKTVATQLARNLTKKSKK